MYRVQDVLDRPVAPEAAARAALEDARRQQHGQCTSHLTYMYMHITYYMIVHVAVLNTDTL